jgi:ATPase subunit of ABC transporter with duplicated ATPase domains
VHVAGMVAAGADLILLDEPTNHLDFDTLEVIEAALRAYRGTLVVASHDRALHEAIACDRVIEIRDGGIAA